VSLLIQRRSSGDERGQFDAPVISTREASLRCSSRMGKPLCWRAQRQQKDVTHSGVTDLSGIVIGGCLAARSQSESHRAVLFLAHVSLIRRGAGFSVYVP